MDRTEVRRDATCRGIWQVVFGLEVRFRRRAPKVFLEKIFRRPFVTVKSVTAVTLISILQESR
jgi:hypothetical protein